MLRTKSGLPKHCSWNIDRHGKRRVRFRRGGLSTYLSGTPWSEDFMRQYAQALDGVKARTDNVGAGRTLPGSVNALVVSYYRSPEFRGLKASTQKARRWIIERFRNEHGDKPRPPQANQYRQTRSPIELRESPDSDAAEFALSGETPRYPATS